LDGIELFRNDFVNNFSHEFKTPLSTIRGFARELKNPDLTDEERAEYIEIIISSCDRLTEMSSSVLLLSKLENQQFITGRVPCDLAEQLRDSILMLEQLWEKKNIELRLELDEITYSCDPESLSHVWQNLLSNAIKYCPENGGVIEISCSESDNIITISIADNGIGMDDDTISHIFEKFYQGDTSHKAEGNGLGLALAARIVKLYGGRIEVDSKLGIGSCFRVLLPKGDAAL
jgi:signal transduction histidine kinase